MRKTLLATVSGAAMLAAGPALSADMLSVGVGGYMQQWIGVSDVDDSADRTIEGGVAQQSDSEIHFRGRLEADNGLTFSVKVELEGNSTDNQIDESQLTVRGEFGEIVLGAEDGASVLTHYGVRDVGFTINCGDVGKWINGIDECSTTGLGTAGHDHGDKNQISYYSPRVSGVQFGVTYVPNSKQEAEKADLHDNDEDAWSVGGNFKGEFGGASVAVSAGHHERSQTAPGSDARTFSNVGLQIGMGAFSFDVAYANGDDGMKADSKHDVEVFGVGAMYSDGPMAISLAHMMAEADEGTEQFATQLSGSYTLAPGVAWKSTLFMAEKDRGTDYEDNKKGDISGTSVEGAGFVTGIVIGF